MALPPATYDVISLTITSTPIPPPTPAPPMYVRGLILASS